MRFAEAAELVTFAARPRIADVATALLVTNVLLSTILIAGRIWCVILYATEINKRFMLDRYMQWQMSRLIGRAPSTKSHNRYKGVLMLIIESGAIYALSQVSH